MGTVMCILCGAAVVFAAVVALGELRRYLKDRSPSPPPEPEEVARDPWHARLVILVAFLSVLGALLAWWASTTFANAESASQQVIEQTAKWQSDSTQAQSKVDFDSRLSLLFQNDNYAATQLLHEASGNGPLSELLQADAQVDAAGARALYADGFLVDYPTIASDGSVTYNSSQALASVVPNDSILRTLGPTSWAALDAQAAKDRSIGQKIVLAGALLIGTVFFLTVANLGWKHRRIHMLVPAVVTSAIAFGIVLLGVVQ